MRHLLFYILGGAFGAFQGVFGLHITHWQWWLCQFIFVFALHHTLFHKPKSSTVQGP